MQKYEYLTHEIMNSYYREVVRQMTNSGFIPDVILAPMRGGADFGVKLSNYYNVPFVPLTWQTRDGKDKDVATFLSVLDEWQDSSILLVDDICDTGYTINELVSLANAEELHEFRVAVAIENLEADSQIDYSAREISRTEDPQWFVFPWESWWK